MNIKISPVSVLLISVLVYITSISEVMSLFLAIVIHELGHILAIHLCGEKIASIKFSANGAKIDYSGLMTKREEFLALVTGPLFGLIFGLIFIKSKQEFLSLSATISLILTAYNMLPILPLDGGRLVNLLINDEKMEKLSFVFIGILSLLGLIILYKYEFIGIIIAVIWLLVLRLDL